MTAGFAAAAFKMVGSLVLVLALILGLSYWLRRQRRGTLTRRNIPAMRLLGTVSLAPRRAVALVEVCDQWYVLGVGAETVTPISKIDPPPDMKGDETLPNEQKGRFQDILKNAGFLGGRPGPGR